MMNIRTRHRAMRDWRFATRRNEVVLIAEGTDEEEICLMGCATYAFLACHEPLCLFLFLFLFVADSD